MLEQANIRRHVNDTSIGTANGARRMNTHSRRTVLSFKMSLRARRLPSRRIDTTAAPPLTAQQVQSTPGADRRLITDSLAHDGALPWSPTNDRPETAPNTPRRPRSPA